MAGAYLNYFCFDKNKSDLATYIERSIVDVMMPSGIAAIGEYAFASCDSLRNIEIPDTVTRIHDKAFYNCSSLESLVIPDSVTEIGEGACQLCASLSNVVLSDNIAELPKDCFRQADRVETMLFPRNLQSIGENALSMSGCHTFDFTMCLTTPALGNVNAFEGISDGAVIYVPPRLFDEWATAVNWVKLKGRIGCYPGDGFTFSRIAGGYEVIAMDECTNDYASIPSTCNGLAVTSIGYMFGEGSDMVGVIIPEGVKRIETAAFQSCNDLKRVTLPDSLETLSISTFSNCRSLESVSFGKGLKEIWGWSFYDNPSCMVYDFTRCTRIPDLYWYFDEGDTFYALPSGARFIVPSELLDEWRSATNWSYFASRIVAG